MCYQSSYIITFKFLFLLNIRIFILDTFKKYFTRIYVRATMGLWYNMVLFVFFFLIPSGLSPRTFVVSTSAVHKFDSRFLQVIWVHFIVMSKFLQAIQDDIRLVSTDLRLAMICTPKKTKTFVSWLFINVLVENTASGRSTNIIIILVQVIK